MQTTYKDKNGKIITKQEYERLQKGGKDKVEAPPKKMRRRNNHANETISDSSES